MGGVTQASQSVRVNYTHKELIELCHRAIVPVHHWRNRDSHSAQMQLGQLLVLLTAGCPFEIVTAENDPGSPHITTHSTIVVNVKGIPDFAHMDSGRDMAEETFYMPTAQRLEQRVGTDWY